ncbi:MAG: MATE family efflux transporter [Clostridia bacterium]|nr:MATE family efflux transporter [Clostridia bacterium]MBQ4157525.1 MATE family efflux transporter [Clostridia bacterium]
MNVKNQTLDFTRGEPMRLLIRFSIPMLLGAVFQIMYNMVDSAVLGRFVSKNALAAVGATSSIGALIMMVINAVTNGFSIMASQTWGAKKREEIPAIISHSLIIALAFSVAVGLFMVFFSRRLLEIMKTPDAIIDDAATYLVITTGMCFGMMFYRGSAAILRAIGDSKTPLMFLIISALVNIVLDLAFVLLFHMDVAGVAWATVIAQAGSAIACIIYMWRKYPYLRFTFRDLNIRGSLLKRFIVIILPMAAQNAMLGIGMMAVSYVINTFGEDIVAAYTVGVRVEQLVTEILSQVAFSFAIFSGQNYGAREFDRIDLGLKRAYKLLGIMTAAAMFIMFAFGRELALLFIKPEEITALGAALRMIYIDTAFMPTLCLIWLYNSLLRGMGHIRPTVISGILELFCKIGFSFLLSRFMGYTGIWLATPIGWIIGLIPVVWRYHFTPWRERAQTMEK